MTRASLLHILDNLGGISETEVQELEQLAATFPYCQTAHLLLAKAAHDRGSMLAAQRLRRAATYAVDRQQLRALIELPAPLPPAEASATVSEEQPEALPLALLSVTGEHPANTSAPKPDSLPAATTTDSPEIVSPDNQAIDTASTIEEPDNKDYLSVTSEAEAGVIEAENTSTEFSLPEAVLPDSTAETPTPASIELHTQLETSHEVDDQFGKEFAELNIDTDSTIESEFPGESVEVEANIAPSSVPESDVIEPSEEPFAPLAELEGPPIASSLETEPTALESTEEELPLALPIRPPAEVGSSRFEFGLAQTLPIPTYNLFEVEKAASKQAVVIPPFWADDEVGYAPGLGSRLGFCLQAHDEYSLDLPPSAFFEPDALLLQHLKQHQPVPPPVPTSIDLIDKFLRSKPRFRAPLPLPPTTEAQADLSVRSTVAEPSLASESLARILVRQGKIAKAIEIYERLIVRQPEKKAYFADQIQQLQTFE